MFKDRQYVYKVAILGPSGSGKSSVMERYTNNMFNLATSTSTGVDFRNKLVKVGDDTLILQIWDTCNNGRYYCVQDSYLKGVAAAIYCIDMSISQQHVDTQKEICKFKNKYPNAKVLICNTKKDLWNKDVLDNNLIAKEHCVSSLRNLGIEELFEDVIEKVHTSRIIPFEIEQ
jgi:Ras-related protein Rab-11B